MIRRRSSLIALSAGAVAATTAYGFSAPPAWTTSTRRTDRIYPHIGEVCSKNNNKRHGRLSILVTRMAETGEPEDAVRTDEEFNTATNNEDDAFSIILFPTLLLKFIVIMMIKIASDAVVYTPQYVRRFADGTGLGSLPHEHHRATSDGHTLAINPDTMSYGLSAAVYEKFGKMGDVAVTNMNNAQHRPPQPPPSGDESTGFSPILLPTMLLKFMVIMIVKTASDAVVYPPQYLERLWTTTSSPATTAGEKHDDDDDAVVSARAEESIIAQTTSGAKGGLEEFFPEFEALSLFLLPVLLLKFAIVMLVKVAKDIVVYPLPYLESLARLERVGRADDNEDDVDFAGVVWTKDGDYWIEE
eukprot:CAMPEP_0181118352 /NCGR_PEP_ID=MMETSP1071-20121207/23028_1 /TAXON_ID=35127 /ORGANISM="Thalassiosira sp., Strain NH16" /LENGTH=357 /DNA_ID=CAMNT_0023202837 /DNA_START=129 /DNA_END=1202 /DNA_ORIENTATION=+